MEGRAYLSPGIAGPVVDSYIRKKTLPREIRSGKTENPFIRLTPRESQVLRQLALGLSPREISKQLGISPKTVETHRSNLFKKLKIQKMTDLIRLAIREGIIAP
jgi:DNA-binding NarL/FixJ family response regulator